MQLHDLIDAQARRLGEARVAFGHGTTNAWDEAAWLTLWQLGLPLDTDLEAQPPVPTAAQQAEVEALIARRIATRLPAAYLTHEAWLQGVDFYVDERVIVPRSLIAELLAQAPTADNIDPWLGSETRHVLDLCTGNGSLAVLAAMAFPETQVDAADLSEDALAVARINVERHGLADRIQVLQSDGFKALTTDYDLILCNPPYVNANSMAALPAEYQAEPVLALAGGDDGMDLIRQLLRDAPARMSEQAVMILEIGNERAHFDHAFPRLEVFWLNTSAGEDQVALLTREALLAEAARQTAA